MVDLIDVVLEGFKAIVEWVTGLFMDGLESGYQTLTEEMFRTPTPQTGGTFIFGEASNAPWPTIQEALIGGEVMYISLLLLVICVQGRHLIRIFNIGSEYGARKTKKTAWIGAFLIITWYWIGVLALYLVDGFTIAMIPELSSVSSAMIQFIKVSVPNTALYSLFVVIGGISMWALEALFYIRQILIYVYLYGMPIAFAIGFGNVPVLSDVAMNFSKRFIPLAILPLPASIVFKGYDILYSGAGMDPETPFIKHLVAVSLPLLAIYLSWKTFKYATPLTAKVLGGATKIVAKGTAKGAAKGGKGTVLIGSVAAGGYVGGAGVASTAARYGPKAAAGHAVAKKVAARGSNGDRNSGTPAYRRTENDPGSY